MRSRKPPKGKALLARVRRAHARAHADCYDGCQAMRPDFWCNMHSRKLAEFDRSLRFVVWGQL